MLIVDRFEGNKAVIEFSQNNERLIFDIPKVALPTNVDEGDVIEIRVNKSITEQRSQKIKELSEQLFE